MGAALVTCALLLLEDPAVIALRHRLAPHAPSIGVDVALAGAMLAYNYVASRYVVGATSAAAVRAAIDRVDAGAAEGAGLVRRVLRGLDPLRLVKAAAERVATLAARAGARAHRRRRHRLARGLADLAAVNVLGVPGVGLEEAVRGRVVRPVDSLRHAALFVLSWFVGARVIEAVVRATSALPVVGPAVRPAFSAVGHAVRTLTDVSRPTGLVTLVAVVAFVLRLARRIDRLAGADDPA